MVINYLKMLYFYGKTNLLVRNFIRNTGDTVCIALSILELCQWFHKSLRRCFVLNLVMVALSSAPKVQASTSPHTKVFCWMRQYTSKLVHSFSVWKAVVSQKLWSLVRDALNTREKLWKARVLHLKTSTHKQHRSVIPSQNCRAFVPFLNQISLLL